MATTSRKSTSRHLNTFQRTKRGLPSQALKPEQRRRRLSFDKEQAAVSDDKDENYVPRSIYKNVNYKAKGENKTVSPSLLLAAKQVEAHCTIPEHFNFGSSRYGPLSGSCYEERLVSNFLSGKIEIENGTFPKQTKAFKTSVRILLDHGFDESESLRALFVTKGNVEQAKEILAE